MQPIASQNDNIQQTTANFQQQYLLMKSYLMKKRFTFVYEQCMKFYAKNNTAFSNHQVLLLIKMIFYILKKKMIAKCNSGGKLTLQGLNQIYSVMTNVFMSWQTVLITQMTAQESEFFSMLFRMRSYKINKPQSFIEKPDIDTLIFKPKPDFIITKKINLQYKSYNFFKQLLRMTINSVTIMLPCLEVQNIGRLVNTIKKSQTIMQQFQQHLFPVEKIQFYLLKCRIYEYASKELGLCLKIYFKYEFPVGLFGLIYKNLQKWKQGKVMHYINLLMKVLFVSVRNELMTVEDIYILGWEVRLLLRIVKKRESLVIVQGFIRDQDKKSRQRVGWQKNTSDNNSKVEFSRKFQQPNDSRLRSSSPTKEKRLTIISNNTTKKSSLAFSQNNYNQRQPQQQNQKDQQNFSKPTATTLLRIVLIQIEKFLAQKKEMCHIVSCYMAHDYKKYKHFDPNEELVDQIPTLINDLKKKKRSNRQNQQNRKNDLNTQELQKVKIKNDNGNDQPLLNLGNKLSLSKKSSLKQSTSTNQKNYLIEEESSSNSYDNNLLSDRKDKFFSKRKQAENQKGKEIILRNINNVKGFKNKGKNKLTLDSNRRKDNTSGLMTGMDTKRTGVTMGSQSSFLGKQQNENSKNFIVRQLLTQTLNSPQLPSISLSSLHQPIPFLQQSSSDSQNELSQQFQTKRRQEISLINNKYYKATNVNYLINLQSLKNSTKNFNSNDNNNQSRTKKFYIDENNYKNQQQQKDTDQNEDGFLNEGMNKGSEEIEYQQIKMIDEVIKQKVLTLIDVEIDNLYEGGDGSNKRYVVVGNDHGHSNLLQKKRQQNNQPNSTSSNTIRLTSKLLKEVQQLNKQQKNLKQILKSKMQTNKIIQNLQQIQTKNVLFIKSNSSSQKSSTEQLIRDLNEVYSISGNVQEKTYKYQQMYRKLLKIKDQGRNNSLVDGIRNNKNLNNPKHPTKQKNKLLLSTIKHYANIHKLYNRQQHNYDHNNKLSIIGETAQQQQQLQLTNRQSNQQQYQQQQQQKISQDKNNNKTKKPIISMVNSQLQEQIREKQRQLKFNDMNNMNQMKNVSKYHKNDLLGLNNQNNVTERKQITLREQFNNLRVDVGRSRFNQSNFNNNNSIGNKKLLIAANANLQLQ